MDHARPKVSYALTLNDQDHSIQQFVNDLLTQSSDCEVVIVDRSGKAPMLIEGARVYQESPESHPIQAVNRALTLSRGEILRYISPEQLPENDETERLGAAFKRNPAAIAAVLNGPESMTGLQWWGPGARFLKLLHRIYRSSNYPGITSLAIKREAWVASQRFDSHPNSDQILLLELSLLGKIINLPVGNAAEKTQTARGSSLRSACQHRVKKMPRSLNLWDRTCIRIGLWAFS